MQVGILVESWAGINRLESEIAFHERFLRRSLRAVSLVLQKRS